jgi:hypothetical protein
MLLFCKNGFRKVEKYPCCPLKTFVYLHSTEAVMTPLIMMDLAVGKQADCFRVDQ